MSELIKDMLENTYREWLMENYPEMTRHKEELYELEQMQHEFQQFRKEVRESLNEIEHL